MFGYTLANLMRQFAIKCISTLVGLTTFDTVISTLEVKDLPLKVS